VPQPPNAPPPVPVPPQAPVKHNPVQQGWRWFRRQHIVVQGIIVVVLLAVVGGLANAGGGSGTPTTIQTTTTQQTSQQAPKATNTPRPPTATPMPSKPHFGDGTYQVGKDIQPGTYRTRVGSPGCYYERLKGFSGDLSDIIANDNTDAPAVVTIAASDAGFHSERCGTWTQDLSQITQSKTSFGDGIYIVGTDLEPGTYKNSGGQGCYWARLSGFGGTLDEIKANGNTDTSTIVTIVASDKGFQSNRCGTWTKQ